MNKNLLVSFLLVTLALGQEARIADKWDMLPEYYSAIEKAADGNFEQSRPVFAKTYKLFKFKQDALINEKICNDVGSGLLSSEAGKYLFKSQFYSGQSEELFYLNRALGIQRNYPLTFIVRGKYYLKKKNYDFAIQEFDQAISISPNHFLAYYYRGKTLRIQEKENEALHDLNMSIENDNNFVASYLERFSIFFSLNQRDFALNDYKMARKVDSTMARGLELSAQLNDIGVFYQRNKKFDKALVAFSQAIFADPRWNEPFLNRGISYRVAGQYEYAISDFNKAIKIKNDFAEAYYNRGITYKEMDEPESAAKDLQMATILNEQYENAHMNLGKIYKNLENYDKAIYSFQKVISINKNNTWAYYWLALSFDNKKNYSRAVSNYEKFLSLADDKYYKHKLSTKSRIRALKKYLR